MAEASTSWLRDTRAKFVAYAAAGVTFLPAAVVWAWLSSKGESGPLVFLVLFAISLPLVLSVWSRTYRRFGRPGEPLAMSKAACASAGSVQVARFGFHTQSASPVRAGRGSSSAASVSFAIFPARTGPRTVGRDSGRIISPSPAGRPPRPTS